MNNLEKKGEKWTNRFIAKPISTTFMALIVVCMLFLGFKAVGGVFGWFGGAMNVVQTEMAPQVLQKKYEWFKDTAAILGAKQASIAVNDSRLAVFAGMSRKEMDRTDKQQQAQIMAETAGIRMAYNNLAAEWNAQISKWNWKLVVGDLPAGASTTLSKTFAAYEM